MFFQSAFIWHQRALLGAWAGRIRHFFRRKKTKDAKTREDERDREGLCWGVCLLTGVVFRPSVRFFSQVADRFYKKWGMERRMSLTAEKTMISCSIAVLLSVMGLLYCT
jgi:hypothetical protein